MIEGFSHVQLVVRDVPASAEWYCAVLGLEQFVSGVTDSGPYVGLRHPTARFVVGMQTATAEQADRLDSGAIDHLSFSVGDQETLERMRDELSAGGIQVSAILEEAASYNVQITDPNGLVLELSASKRSKS